MNTQCKRTVVFEETPGRYDLGRWAVKGVAGPALSRERQAVGIEVNHETVVRSSYINASDRILGAVSVAGVPAAFRRVVT
jgi:hypothetical protein